MWQPPLSPSLYSRSFNAEPTYAFQESSLAWDNYSGFEYAEYPFSQSWRPPTFATPQSKPATGYQQSREVPSCITNTANRHENHFVKVSDQNWTNSPQPALPDESVPLSNTIEEEISGQSLYKTELCRSFEETGACRYDSKCQFAHGKAELRPVLRHPKYKTEICKTFYNEGTCPYGTRCRFIHTESPALSPLPSTHILPQRNRKMPHVKANPDFFFPSSSTNMSEKVWGIPTSTAPPPSDEVDPHSWMEQMSALTISSPEEDGLLVPSQDVPLSSFFGTNF